MALGRKGLGSRKTVTMEQVEWEEAEKRPGCPALDIVPLISKVKIAVNVKNFHCGHTMFSGTRLHARLGKILSKRKSAALSARFKVRYVKVVEDDSPTDELRRLLQGS